MTIQDIQREICAKYRMEFEPPFFGQVVGISKNLFSGELPINGLRHPPTGETSGWYIWVGTEWSEADDFFEPLHIDHLDELLPKVLPYLGLPAGARFLIADNYEDVWFDESLLVI